MKHKTWTTCIGCSNENQIPYNVDSQNADERYSRKK